MVFNVCPIIFHAENPSKNKGMSHRHWTTTISTEPTINIALVLSCSTRDFASTIYMHELAQRILFLNITHFTPIISH